VVSNISPCFCLLQGISCSDVNSKCHVWCRHPPAYGSRVERNFFLQAVHDVGESFYENFAFVFVLMKEQTDTVVTLQDCILEILIPKFCRPSSLKFRCFPQSLHAKGYFHDHFRRCVTCIVETPVSYDNNQSLRTTNNILSQTTIYLQAVVFALIVRGAVSSTNGTDRVSSRIWTQISVMYNAASFNVFLSTFLWMVHLMLASFKPVPRRAF
jgi:hypothetical protein